MDIGRNTVYDWKERKIRLDGEKGEGRWEQSKENAERGKVGMGKSLHVKREKKGRGKEGERESERVRGVKEKKCKHDLKRKI